MIRGILIFGVGFGLGYAKALYDMPDIRETLIATLEVLKEKDEEKTEAEEEPVVESDDTTDKPQGETPS